jgi:hypothetical protein
MHFPRLSYDFTIFFRLHQCFYYKTKNGPAHRHADPVFPRSVGLSGGRDRAFQAQQLSSRPILFADPSETLALIEGAGSPVALGHQKPQALSSLQAVKPVGPFQELNPVTLSAKG